MAAIQRTKCPVCGTRRCPCEHCHTECGLNHNPTRPVADFPTVDNCNINCPEEAFLPFLVGLPGMVGASMAVPISALGAWSKRIWDGGGRRTEPQRIFYHPPRAGELSPMLAAGRWDSTPPNPSESPIDVGKLSGALQAELRRQLDEKDATTAKNTRPPMKSSDHVGEITRFNPAHHTVTEVLAHLRTATAAEVARVFAAEERGSQRAGILKRRNRYPGVEP